MNGTMPATVNSSEGSLETSDAEGTAVWPLLTKKSTQRFVISCDFMSCFLTLLVRAEGGTGISFKWRVLPQRGPAGCWVAACVKPLSALAANHFSGLDAQ